jgi:hypothetical protein
VLVGGADVSSNGGDTYLAWTDVWPDVVGGDFDGNEVVDPMDALALDGFISANDGMPPIDEDGVANGVIDLVDFGLCFAVYDLDYDGYVDYSDQPVPVDVFNGDHDGDIDLADFAMLQACFTGSGGGPYDPYCLPFDRDLDQDVDMDDLSGFVLFLTGPE